MRQTHFNAFFTIIFLEKQFFSKKKKIYKFAIFQHALYSIKKVKVIQDIETTKINCIKIIISNNIYNKKKLRFKQRHIFFVNNISTYICKIKLFIKIN